MNITLNLPDPIIAQAHQYADEQSLTLEEVFVLALQVRLAQKNPAEKPYVLADASVGGQGLNPEYANADWPTIRALIYEGHGG